MERINFIVKEEGEEILREGFMYDDDNFIGGKRIDTKIYQSNIDSWLTVCYVLGNIEIIERKSILWKSPEKHPPKGEKVIIAAANYTAIGYYDEDEEQWYRWIDFTSYDEDKEQWIPFESKPESHVYAWQPMPYWQLEDFSWSKELIND